MVSLCEELSTTGRGGMAEVHVCVCYVSLQHNLGAGYWVHTEVEHVQRPLKTSRGQQK